MTWYTTPGPPAHRGSLVRGRLNTDCGVVYQAGKLLRVILAAGRTLDPEDACPICGGHAVRITWGLSVLDWRSHAVDEKAWHPTGVYKALCGHRLMMVTTLYERYGRLCDACAALTQATR